MMHVMMHADNYYSSNSGIMRVKYDREWKAQGFENPAPHLTCLFLDSQKRQIQAQFLGRLQRELLSLFGIYIVPTYGTLLGKELRFIS